MRSKGVGSDDPQAIAEAAANGRVRTLLMEADRIIPGCVDHQTGRTKLRQLDDPEVDDLLDDLGEMVLDKSGDVVVVPADRMPTQTGVAAIYRF